MGCRHQNGCRPEDSPSNWEVPNRVGDALRTAEGFRLAAKRAKVRLGSEGILDPTNVNMDLVGASGPPIENNDRLKTVEYEYKTGYFTPEMATKLKKIVNDLIDDMTARESPADQTASPTGRDQQQVTSV